MQYFDQLKAKSAKLQVRKQQWIYSVGTGQ